MERKICVKGTGKVSLKADRIRLRLELIAKHTDYGEIYRLSAAQAKETADAFAKLGFAREDLKPASFWVNPEYESYQDESFGWKQRFVGYMAVQALAVEFDRDTERLGKLLLAIAGLSFGPSFTIDYTVKDQEGAKAQMLKNAVEDSRRKAVLLTEAAGVRLGQIVNIDYSWTDVTFGVQPMNEMKLLRSAKEEASVADFAAQLEPEEIRAEDTVTVIWEIE